MVVVGVSVVGVSCPHVVVQGVAQAVVVVVVVVVVWELRVSPDVVQVVFARVWPGVVNCGTIGTTSLVLSHCGPGGFAGPYANCNA